jgi:hypothetical protein
MGSWQALRQQTDRLRLQTGLIVGGLVEAGFSRVAASASEWPGCQSIFGRVQFAERLPRRNRRGYPAGVTDPGYSKAPL